MGFGFDLEIDLEVLDVCFVEEVLGLIVCPIMPKTINWENLAKGYQVPIKNVSDFNKLREAFEWSLSMQKSVIIKVDINVENEMKGRNLILKKILTN